MPWATWYARVVWAVVLASFVYVFFRYLAPPFSRRTRWEIDDLLAGLLCLPLSIVALGSGLLVAVPLLPLSDGLVGVLSRLITLVLIFASSWLVLRVARQVVVRYAVQYTRRTASNLDDVLIPLVARRVLPLLIWTLAGVFVLWAFGVNLGGVMAGLGAASFLLIFLFQEPLSNLFSGLYLVMDVPFKYGDLLVLEDGKTYRVEEIGARVTRFYDIDRHTIAYVPNSKLAGQTIVNLTKPNVELRAQIQVGVGYSTQDLEHVTGILAAVAERHPHVLGRANVKVEALTARLRDAASPIERIRLAMEIDRIQVEEELRGTGEYLVRKIALLAEFVHNLERRGLSRDERARIGAFLDEIWPVVARLRRKLTVWLHLVSRLDVLYKLQEPVAVVSAASLEERLPTADQIEAWRQGRVPPQRIAEELVAKEQLAVLGTFPDSDEELHTAGGDVWLQLSREVNSHGLAAELEGLVQMWMHETPVWTLGEDFTALHREWHRATRELVASLERCSQLSGLRGEREFQLDDALRDVVRLIEAVFPLKVPGWQFPDADLIGLGASSIDFRLEFFVNDLVREHFERLDDVVSEVVHEVVRELRAAGVEVPFPQVDVWFRDAWARTAVEGHTRGRSESGHKSGRSDAH